MLGLAATKMQRIGELLDARRAIDCVVAVSSLGTADGASLLNREASRIPAGATDLHGPMDLRLYRHAPFSGVWRIPAHPGISAFSSR